ncbi:MAG TPA: universal stress protein [Microlunatus sp.]
MRENLVVVGVDDSSTARAALEWAADYARMTDYRLVAVHVRMPEVPAYLYTPQPTEQELADTETYRHVRLMFEGLDPENDWRLIRLTGRPGEELVKQSERAVLLVIGTQDHIGLHRWLESSVSQYCLRHSTVPVLCYPNPKRHQTQSLEQVDVAVPAGSVKGR